MIEFVFLGQTSSEVPEPLAKLLEKQHGWSLGFKVASNAASKNGADCIPQEHIGNLGNLLQGSFLILDPSIRVDPTSLPDTDICRWIEVVRGIDVSELNNTEDQNQLRLRIKRLAGAAGLAIPVQVADKKVYSSFTNLKESITSAANSRIPTIFVIDAVDQALRFHWLDALSSLAVSTPNCPQIIVKCQCGVKKNERGENVLHPSAVERFLEAREAIESSPDNGLRAVIIDDEPGQHVNLHGPAKQFFPNMRFFPPVKYKEGTRELIGFLDRAEGFLPDTSDKDKLEVKDTAGDYIKEVLSKYRPHIIWIDLKMRPGQDYVKRSYEKLEKARDEPTISFDEHCKKLFDHNGIAVFRILDELAISMRDPMWRRFPILIVRSANIRTKKELESDQLLGQVDRAAKSFLINPNLLFWEKGPVSGVRWKAVRTLAQGHFQQLSDEGTHVESPWRLPSSKDFGYISTRKMEIKNDNVPDRIDGQLVVSFGYSKELGGTCIRLLSGIAVTVKGDAWHDRVSWEIALLRSGPFLVIKTRNQGEKVINLTFLYEVTISKDVEFATLEMEDHSQFEINLTAAKKALTLVTFISQARNDTTLLNCWDVVDRMPA